MAHRSSSLGTRKSCSAGIRKEVKHIYLTSGTADLLRHKVPVYRLFGEESGMLESGGTDIEGEISVADIPRFRKLLPEHPFSSA